MIFVCFWLFDFCLFVCLFIFCFASSWYRRQNELFCLRLKKGYCREKGKINFILTFQPNWGHVGQHNYVHLYYFCQYYCINTRAPISVCFKVALAIFRAFLSNFTSSWPPADPTWPSTQQYIIFWTGVLPTKFGSHRTF